MEEGYLKQGLIDNLFYLSKGVGTIGNGWNILLIITLILSRKN